LPYLSQRIRECREAKNLTQKQAALAMGLSYRTWQEYEGGRRSPTIEGIVDIATYFGVSIDYLTGRIDDPTQGRTGEVFISNDGQEVLLDQDDPLRESFHQAQEQFETGELGARVTVQMVVDAARDRAAFFESHPYMKAYWTLMYKLATEHPDVSNLLSGAKLANEQVKIIADTIRAVIPRRG
jgi:transcriptional regulator with XRE-family HTH domain